jgi:SAM-dependent methyltransferase
VFRSQFSVLPANTDLLIEFPSWVISSCNSNSSVLEIGAGRGVFGYPELIRSKVNKLVGIDPDIAIYENPYLNERYQLTAEEFAQKHNAKFDCLYSMFVVEHVSAPDQFLSACKSLLRPGGTFYAMTPNLWHYFGMVTTVSNRLGVEDWLLERLRGSQVKGSYHFPTRYHLNDVGTVARACKRAGFSQTEFRLYDPPQRFSGYLPRPLRWFPYLWSNAVYTLHLPQFMGMMMYKATV